MSSSELQWRLTQALKVLVILKRTYKDDKRYYQDQLDYVAALREHLNAVIDYPTE